METILGLHEKISCRCGTPLRNTERGTLKR